jgi:uncharacterized protein involved in outer membrane biogenesis
MRRGLRVVLLASLVLAAVLVAAAGAFLAGLEVSGEILRTPLERALTAAFRVPTRIEGPLKLHTGLAATVSADALVLADPSGPDGATIARGIRPAARIDLVALLERRVALEEVTGERLELTLIEHGDGSANWAPIFAARPAAGKAPVSFAGVARLQIGGVTGSYLGEGATPLRFEVTALDGTLPLHEPVTARASVVVAGQPLAFDLRSASLADLAGSGAAIPLLGTMQWSGAHATIDGTVARDGSRFDADVRASADDASPPLAAIGIAAKEPGPLEVRMRVGVTAKEAVARDLDVSIGRSAGAGSASVAWAAPRWRIAADISGKRVDVGPLLSAESPRHDETASQALLALLERTATGVDAQVKLAIDELAGLPLTATGFAVAVGSHDRVVGTTIEAVVSGVRVRTSIDYDAREPQRNLSVRLGGGKASTAQLPREVRSKTFSASLAGMRGQVRGQGADAHAILDSLQGELEARDLRWVLARSGQSRLAGRFDLVRVAVRGASASSAKVTGKLGDAACTLEISGGPMAILLEGESWPMKLDGSCPGERLRANGSVAVAPGHVVAGLSFDATADRIGPAARAIGVPPTTPHPLAARGRLALDEKRARVRMDALQIGRTAGSGELAVPIRAAEAPRVRLSLTTLDLTQFDARGAPGPTPADPLEREVLPRSVSLPDLDFEIAADRVAVADVDLRRLQFSGGIRSQKIPPARFRLELEGVPLSGEFGADFSGAVPRVQFDGNANDPDLHGWLARFGHSDTGLRADRVSLRAQAEGVRLGELLTSATLSAAIDNARLDLPRSLAPEPPGRSNFSATLDVQPGEPARLAAHGSVGEVPMRLAVNASRLVDIERTGEATPLSLQMTLGDMRLDARGKLARDGNAEGRLQIAGARLDRLGKLLGLQWPAAGPYSASGDVVVSDKTVRATELALSFGRSRAVGDLRFESAGPGHARSVTQLQLKVPALHLEDIDAAHWIAGTARGDASGARNAHAARSGEIEREIGRGVALLRGADFDATVDVDAVHSAGERFASGRVHATNEAGVLRVRLRDVHAAGGGLDADVSVDASGAQRKLGLRLKVTDLEYGPLVRAVDPTSTMTGTLELAADLTAQGAAENLLPALNGTIDVAMYPRGLYSPALSLWGAGLVHTMLQQLDSDSKSAVDCAVAGLDVDAGVAKSTAFFVDATRVRVVGEFEADLTTRALSGRISPRSKDPRLLNFAPTMLLGGTADNVKLSVAPANIVSVPLRFAKSLAVTPLEWLTARDPGQDGKADCREAFEQIRRARSSTMQPVPR